MVKARLGIGTVNSTRKGFYRRFWEESPFGYQRGRLVCLSLALLVCGSPVLGQSPNAPAANSGLAAATAPEAGQSPQRQTPGRVNGRVVDPTGVAAVGATVKLGAADQSLDQETLTDEDGRFAFTDVAPGPFRLTISAPGFATQTYAGNLRPGEINVVPQVVLPIATNVTEIRVVPPPSQIEVAREQLKEEEKQRALGFIPNFYVTYIPNAAPLTAKQKFTLAGKILIDPVTFGITGVIAGLEQADNVYGGYGQGAEGYAKRYGAAYADTAASTIIGSAILPSVFKQDPRYFYKGSGSKRSRVLYAMANAVICKGDNGHWQANYSGMLGSLAAAGISNLYYPSHDRGAGLTFENTLIGFGATAAANVLQEFVVRKLTPNLPNHGGTTP
jgi:Carboxypeptidase regulatory-like domain